MCSTDKAKKIQACLEDAREFYDIASNLVKPPMYIAPYFVNCAFCCELYLKALAMMTSADAKYEKTHNLFELFNGLPEKVKNTIREKFEKETTVIGLSELLNGEKEAFEKWRYNYEVNILSGNITGFDALAKALHFCAMEMKEEEN